MPQCPRWLRNCLSVLSGDEHDLLRMVRFSMHATNTRVSALKADLKRMQAELLLQDKAVQWLVREVDRLHCDASVDERTYYSRDKEPHE